MPGRGSLNVVENGRGGAGEKLESMGFFVGVTSGVSNLFTGFSRWCWKEPELN